MTKETTKILENGSKKEFDRSMCFTFFEDYFLTAKEIEADLGCKEALEYYNAIISYALYGDNPELKGAIKYIWPTTKSNIDRSIDSRKRSFNGEDIEMTEKVLKYKKSHQEASQREIAEACGCSLHKVNNVLKKYKHEIDCISDVPSGNIYREEKYLPFN